MEGQTIKKISELRSIYKSKNYNFEDLFTSIMETAKFECSKINAVDIFNKIDLNNVDEQTKTSIIDNILTWNKIVNLIDEVICENTNSDYSKYIEKLVKFEFQLKAIEKACPENTKLPEIMKITKWRVK